MEEKNHICIKSPLPYRVIRSNFEFDYCYTFNLNPDRKKFTADTFVRLCDYFKKKKHSYWLVECTPPDNPMHKHYHGMIKLNNPPNDLDKMIKFKKAIYKQINNYIGRSVPFERPDSLNVWYDYIHGRSNVCLSEHFNFNIDKNVVDDDI